MTTLIRSLAVGAGLVGWALVVMLFNRWTHGSDPALALFAVLLMILMIILTLAFTQEVLERRRTAKAAAKWASKPANKNRGR